MKFRPAMTRSRAVLAVLALLLAASLTVCPSTAQEQEIVSDLLPSRD